MIIKGAKVYTEEGTFADKEVCITGEVFTETGGDGEKVVDGSGCYLIPGLTDIHFHGCMGKDFCDGTEESIQVMADYEASQGVTTIAPATMTFDEERLIRIAKAAKAHKNEKGAILCGINMEGPFISMAKKGAQNGKYIHKPDVAMFERLQEAAGGLLSIAHTTADYETAKTAIEAGVTHMTHLYNAMNPIKHRAPGPIIAAADDEYCEAELICDNVHIHPAIVRNTFKMFGEDRVIFISDTMEAAGLEDGMYELGGQPVIVKGNRATLEDGTIAGSNTNLMKCMRTAVKQMGIPLEKAVKCAAVNPAKSIGIYDQYGSITPGKVANAVLLDQETLEIKGVILKGQML